MTFLSKANMAKLFVLLAMATMLAGLVARAQQNVGSIRGTVQDPSKAAVPGTSVVCRNEATGIGLNPFAETN